MGVQGHKILQIKKKREYKSYNFEKKNRGLSSTIYIAGNNMIMLCYIQGLVIKNNKVVTMTSYVMMP